MKRIRTCIGCGTKGAKDEFMRFMKVAGKAPAFDPTGTGAGRGAYVCSEQCFKRARKSNRFSHVLRVRVTEEMYRDMAEQFEDYSAVLASAGKE